MTALVVAITARALAEAAARADDPALVMDCFADLDTRRSALGVVKINQPGSEIGFTLTDLELALNEIVTLAAKKGVIVDRLIIGCGFEDRAMLVDRFIAMARKSFGMGLRVIGNDALTISMVKDPASLASLFRQNGLQHPVLRLGWNQSRNLAVGEWLIKQIGGYGGGHVRHINQVNKKDQLLAKGQALLSVNHQMIGSNEYIQEFIDGEIIGIVFFAHAGQCHILGATLNWINPSIDQEFRWGGVAGPFLLPESFMQHIYKAISVIVFETSLNGINGIDILIPRNRNANSVIHDIGIGRIFGLEINPRPPASMEVLDTEDSYIWRTYLQSEVSISNNERKTLPTTMAKARGIIYAPQDMIVPEDYDWPEMVCDYSAGLVKKGEPLASVKMQAVDAASAMKRVKRKIEELTAQWLVDFCTQEQKTAAIDSFELESDPHDLLKDYIDHRLEAFVVAESPIIAPKITPQPDKIVIYSDSK